MSKWRLHRIVLSVLLVGCMALTGCIFDNRSSDKTDREYTVVIQDSDYFDADVAVATVKAGGSFSTELVFEPGYFYDSCNYSDCEIEETEKGVKLTINNINHDYRVVVKSDNIELSTSFPTSYHTITYYANGGSWQGEGEQRTESYTLSYHQRANTSIGNNLSRSGYTLLGWNTKADGSGDHVGLGSRTDYAELYAEWVEWLDAADFVYARVEGGIALTGYKGKGDTEYFAIPAVIDGLEVISIDTSFTTNMRCGAINSKKLVLPQSVKSIAANAFKNSSFDEIYFYDTLENVDDKAFGNPIATWHINAGTAPVYQYENDNARFADKIDYLMMQEGKRLVIFAGCSAAYGICSELLAQEFTDYSICNMGVIGGVNAIFQMEIIGSFLRSGDVFLHLPEEMSKYQLMGTYGTDLRMFIMVEGNYDLMALADFSYSETIWSSYTSYKKEKSGYPDGSYSDEMISYNQYGDICFGRPYSEENAWENDVSLSDGTYQFDLDILTAEGIKRLCDFYNLYSEKGVAVYVSYAPVNIDGLDSIESAEQYEQKFCEMIGEYGYKPIGELKNHLFRGRYFYDSDYHLNNFGAILHTKALIEELKKYI